MPSHHPDFHHRVPRGRTGLQVARIGLASSYGIGANALEEAYDRWGRLLNPGRMPPGEPTPQASDCYRFGLTLPEIDVCLAGPKDAAEVRVDPAVLDRGPMDEAALARMCRIGDHIHGGS